MSETNMGSSIGWNDTIEQDGQDFTILEPGDYDFYVEDYERGYFNGSDKVAPCNKAILDLRIKGPDGKIIKMKHNLLMNTKMEWKLSEFFRAIGLKKRGEKLTLDWNKVPHATGKVHISPREYTGRDGKQKKSNNVDYFIDPEDSASASSASTPSASAAAAEPGPVQDNFQELPDDDNDPLPF